MNERTFKIMRYILNFNFLYRRDVTLSQENSLSTTPYEVKNGS